jgi:hypothetical protein
MKNRIKTTLGKPDVLTLIFVSIFLILTTKAQSQCVYCDIYSTTNGSFSSAIGKNNHANGDFSFVGGEGSKAYGRSSFSFGQSNTVFHNYSFALGRFLEVHGSNSFAIGRYLKTLNPESMVIGYGFSDTQTLNNNIPKSLMIGFESTKPTLFVGPSIGASYTGKVGVGNVTDPQAKLHIRADDGMLAEDATLLLEAQGSKSSIFTLAGQTGNIVFSGGSGNIGVAAFRNPLNFYTADLQNNPQLRMTIEGERGFVGIGTATPETRLEIKHNSGENALRIRRNEKIFDFRISDSDHLQILDRENTRLTIRSNGEIKTESNLIVEGSLLSEKLSGHFPRLSGICTGRPVPLLTSLNLQFNIIFYI